MKPFSLAMLLALLLPPLHTAHAEPLRVVNGDFGDLGGLTPHGGHGWHQGVPAGWKSTAPFPLYAIDVGPNGTQPACNVSQLGVLEQPVGTLPQAADVELTMDVTDEWKKGAQLDAAILDGDGELLGRIQVDAGRGQRLVVTNVAAGTAVVIRFRSLNGTTPALDNVHVTTRAAGSSSPTPQLWLRRFQPDQPLARARRVASISAEIDHLNVEDVDVTVSLSLPPGVRVVRGPDRPVHRLRAAASHTRLTWNIEADAATTADLRLDVKAVDGGPVAHELLRMLFLPSVEPFSPSYIPEPVPVAADRLVGAHHCPLWEADQPDMWLNLLRHPERTPALGLYAQNDPEVADWETKWAVEHGISFFIYCWYRTSQGGAVKTRFGSAIHDGLFKSRFADRMKFTLMWENQARGTAGVAGEEDLFRNLLPYWIDTYFKHGGYLKVDNKPVLFIYRPEFLVDDLGSVANVASAFERMRQVCRAAGFDGLIILGEYRGTDRKHLELMKSLGLDYTFAYCWALPGSPTPERAVQAQLDLIRTTQEIDILPQVVTVSQAWSGWQDEGTIWKIPPPQYEDLLRKAKAFTAGLPQDQLGSRMLLLDNWNEWGEGHYIAPYREHGFGYLDAVRRVFTAAPGQHVDLLPEDIGRGPYDTVARRHYAALEEKSRLAATYAVKSGGSRGLAAWWTFDEASDSPVAVDQSGHRRGGYVEKATRVPGFEGTALRCDGGSVFIPQSWPLGDLQAFSVACRVKTDVADQDNRWMVNSVFGHNVCGGFRLGVLRGRPCFQVPQTAWSHHLSGDKPLPPGRWVHLAATFDGAVMRLYMDGEECGVMARPGARVPTDGRIVLGNYDVSHPAFFAGLLDDVRLHRRALPPEEIRSNAAATPR
jgi:hypothetical protein